MVRPAYKANANTGQATDGPDIPWSVATQIKPADQCGSCWRRQALKVTLVHDRRVDIEAGQTECRASAINKGSKPTPTPQPPQRPLIGDQRRCSAERHHVGERIHLLTKSALGIGHPGNPAVQAVEHHRAKNTCSSKIKAPIHRHDNGVKATEQGGQSKQVRQHIDAFAPVFNTATITGRTLGFYSIMHAISREGL